MDYTIIATSISTLLAVLIPAYLVHKREIKKHLLETEKYRNELELAKHETKQDKLKINFFNRAMDLTRINPIIDGVEKMFSRTKADRFLILIAINGKTDFNIVSVIFEQHKPNGYKINAIGTYRNIHIDNDYRNMLRASEIADVDVEVNTMNDCLLKEFYEIEGVKYSKIKFLDRVKIDETDDFVVFSSLATHVNQPFSKRENTIIKTVYESTIIPNIEKILD